MSEVVFAASRREIEIIAYIAARFFAITQRTGNRLTLNMDLEACHCNGCPLDLIGLKNAEAIDLVHDVAGIERNINRDTGQMENGFWPRYAMSCQTV